MASNRFIALAVHVGVVGAGIAAMTRQKAESAELGDEGRRAICILDPQPNQIAKGIVKF